MRRSGVRSPSAPPTLSRDRRSRDLFEAQRSLASLGMGRHTQSVRRPQLNHPKPADLGLTAKEGAALRALKSPEQIQEFVIGLHANFEFEGDTRRSVRGVLQHRQAHCIEAAFTAACALWLQGRPPLLMDLTAKGDSDHVIALFKQDGCWGAISKSNHVWLRWRDPVYRSLRELA